jgi:hypothetical protein
VDERRRLLVVFTRFTVKSVASSLNLFLPEFPRESFFSSIYSIYSRSMERMSYFFLMSGAVI